MKAKKVFEELGRLNRSNFLNNRPDFFPGIPIK
jgi:hypothetical protein